MKELKLRARKTSFTLEEHELIHLFKIRCEEFGLTKSGVYNRQDPTHWSTTNVCFQIDNGHKILDIDVEIQDVTWALEFIFKESYGKDLAKAKWDPQDKKWYEVEGDFFDLISRIFTQGQHESEIPDQDHLDLMGYNEI